MSAGGYNIDTQQRSPWIDTLRGIAILMVIAVHASHGLKGSDSLLKTIFGFGGYLLVNQDYKSSIVKLENF